MRTTIHLGHTVTAVLMLGSGLMITGCTEYGPQRSEAPNALVWDPTSTTYEGTGTRGGTNVTGAGPGGPRDPCRYTTPRPAECVRSR